METPDWLKKAGINNLKEVEESCKELYKDQPQEQVELQENMIEWHGDDNLEKIVEKIDKNLDEEIRDLNKQAIDTALNQEHTRDDFSSQETDVLQQEIDKKTALQDNLENPDYFSQN